MPLNQRQRWMVLGSLLALTVTAIEFLDDDSATDNGVVAQSGKHESIQSAAHQNRMGAEQTEVLALDALKRRATEDKPGDAFAARSWYVPPALPKNLPPPPPTAPALPFTYMGRMVDEGKTTVFLTRQDRSYAVKEGDVVDGSYRVDRIDGNSVTMTYLPLNMQQILAMGVLK